MRAEGERTSSPAADTGSAVHAAIAAYHTVAKGDARASLEAMREGLAKYPLADLHDAELSFRPYAADTRNTEAEVVLVEREISLRLAPAETDPTTQEIVIVGTLDQVRRERGLLVVCDVKTGKRLEGEDMLNDHCLQLCAYQLGASALLGEPVRGACVIRTYDYRKKAKGPVFWNAAWGVKDAESLMRGVAHVVANIRAGRAWAAPGEHCRWCPAGSPSGCQQSLRQESLSLASR